MNDIRQKIFNLVLRLIETIEPTQQEARLIRDALPNHDTTPGRLEAVRMLSVRPWTTEEAMRAIGMISGSCPDLMLASYFRHQKLFPVNEFHKRIILLSGLN